MKKTFDCVEMKRRGAERALEATRGMSTEEELAYWAERTAELEERQRVAQERRAEACGSREEAPR